MFCSCDSLFFLAKEKLHVDVRVTVRGCNKLLWVCLALIQSPLDVILLHVWVYMKQYTWQAEKMCDQLETSWSEFTNQLFISPANDHDSLLPGETTRAAHTNIIEKLLMNFFFPGENSIQIPGLRRSYCYLEDWTKVIPGEEERDTETYNDAMGSVKLCVLIAADANFSSMPCTFGRVLFIVYGWPAEG